jgi:hypothetical protein
MANMGNTYARMKEKNKAKIWYEKAWENKNQLSKKHLDELKIWVEELDKM